MKQNKGERNKEQIKKNKCRHSIPLMRKKQQKSIDTAVQSLHRERVTAWKSLSNVIFLNVEVQDKVIPDISRFGIEYSTPHIVCDD